MKVGKTNLNTMRRTFPIKSLLFSLCFIGLFSCTDSSLNSGCPISYSVNQANLDLNNSWRFIGFRTKGQGSLAFPPCEMYGGSPNDTDSRAMLLSFTRVNSTHTTERGLQLFTATGPVNSLEGAYRIEGEGQLFTSKRIGSSRISVQPPLSTYEARFSDALSSMTSYKIEENLLTITFGDGTQEMLLFWHDRLN